MTTSGFIARLCGSPTLHALVLDALATRSSLALGLWLAAAVTIRHVDCDVCCFRTKHAALATACKAVFVTTHMHVALSVTLTLHLTKSGVSFATYHCLWFLHFQPTVYSCCRFLVRALELEHNAVESTRQYMLLQMLCDSFEACQRFHGA